MLVDIGLQPMLFLNWDATIRNLATDDSEFGDRRFGVWGRTIRNFGMDDSKKHPVVFVMLKKWNL